MAQHCWNYHFKTNERYMNEMERTRPLNPADEELVRSCFKEVYHLPIHDWLMIQTDKRRHLLYELLRGNRARKPAKAVDTRGITGHNWTSQRRPDLVALTPKTRIDFNRSIFGPAPFRPDPRAIAPTLVATEGVFGHADPWTPRAQTGSASLPDYFVRHFFKPGVAEKLLPLSDEYFPLIDELIKWTEKKTMGFPIDPLIGHGSITPKAEGALTKQKLEEDHFYPPGHRFVKKTKLARDLDKKTLRAQARKLTASRYQDVFCDEIHEDYIRNGPPPVTPNFRQVGNGTPWGLFPELHDPPKEVDMPLYRQQSRDNRVMGKANKAIFEAKTCL
jgi:hypothetical protein